MRRRHQTSILLAFFCLAIALMNVIFSYFSVMQNQIDYVSRGLYSEGRLTALIQSDVLIDWRLSEYGNYQIMVETPSSNQKAIYLKGRKMNVPLKSGRTFTDNDFYRSKRSILIGSNHEKDTFEKNGRTYFNIYQEDYEVIGVMGTFYSTRLDDMIVMNLDAYERDYLKSSNGLYYFDGSRSWQVLNEIVEQYDEHLSTIKELNIEDKGVATYIGIASVERYFFIFVMVATIISVLISLIYWLHHNRNEMKVYLLLGLRRATVFTVLCKGYFRLSLFSWLLAFVIGNGIVLSTVPYLVKEMNIFLLFLFSVIHILSFLLYILLFHSFYKQISSVL